MDEYHKEEPKYHKGLTMDEYKIIIEKLYDKPYASAIVEHRKKLSRLEALCNTYSD